MQNTLVAINSSFERRRQDIPTYCVHVHDFAVQPASDKPLVL